jgi:ribosomal protein S18 acetylase RimI-like enzyme
MKPTVSLRHTGESDRPLLLRLFASTRAGELAMLPLDEAAKQAFVRMQFEARERSYRAQVPDARFDVILLDSAPIGRLTVARREREIRVVDLALLPEQRGGGIGTTLLEQLAAEADASAATLTLHVEVHNRARSLYQRIGFTEVSRDGVYALLRRLPTR